MASTCRDSTSLAGALAGDSVTCCGASGDTAPPVSVIMPTSRPDQAVAALESLTRQRYRGEVEIVVIGSAAHEIARRWPVVPVQWGNDPAMVRDLALAPASGGVFYGDGYIASKARNLGVQQAHGNILLFLDDDCTVPEDWVERNVRALQQANVGAVGGRIRGKSRTFFARCTDFTNFGAHQHGRVSDGLLAGASMGVHRHVFETVRGFDENQSTSEDTDLCYRIQRQGYRTIYHPEIEVAHDHRRDTFTKFLKYNYTRGRANGLTRKAQNRDRSLRNRLLYCVRFPPAFLCLLPLIAAVATTRIIALNLRDDVAVLKYAPVILVGKLAYELGVFRHLTARQEPHAWMKAAGTFGQEEDGV